VALTFGNTSAPNNITTYLDSLFSTSLGLYRRTLTDNIGASNALLYDLIKSEAYESAEGGTMIGEPLMYGLTPADFYSGYDELSSLPTDGITQVDFEWAQMAAPISYNMKEVFQNKNKIVDLVESKIKQAEMGIQETWAKAFMWGNATNGGLLTQPYVSPTNGALGINPLPSLVSYNTPQIIGGLSDASPNDWWQNQWATSAATTYSGYIYEILNMYNTVQLGTGGPPTHIFMDQVSYQNYQHAYFSVYKSQPAVPKEEYPFEAKMFLQAKVILEDKIPDAYNGVPGRQVGGIVQSGSMQYGSAYFVNSRFFKVRYQSERDWEMLTDENGKTFKKPINGDSRLGHCAWMGQTTINNRRKQGVLAKIARSYTS
jgi:hypothetical protein